MTRLIVATTALLCLAATGALAVEVENLQLKSTRDLLALCSADPSDPPAAEAQQACDGYLARTPHFYRALTSSQRIKPLVRPGRELSLQELADACRPPDHGTG